MIRKTALFLVSLSSGVGHAQDYVPITTDGSRWLYHVISQFQVEDLLSADLGSDTTINGEGYRRLNSLLISGALRDDTGRVWFCPFDQYVIDLLDTVPVLLYDFDLQVGDSFPVPRFPGTWAHITARDSVQLIDGTFRTRLQLATITGPDFILSTGEWIEGIGDPGYLLWALWDLWEVGIWLECYGIDNEPLFGSCLYLGEPDATVEGPYELVPSGNHGRFKLTGALERVQRLTILDAVGKKVRENAMLGGEIDLSQHVAGIYFLRIASSTGQQTIRFCLPQQ